MAWSFEVLPGSKRGRHTRPFDEALQHRFVALGHTTLQDIVWILNGSSVRQQLCGGCVVANSLLELRHMKNWVDSRFRW
jgi:hypothetical protein